MLSFNVLLYSETLLLIVQCMDSEDLYSAHFMTHFFHFRLKHASNFYFPHHMLGINSINYNL